MPLQGKTTMNTSGLLEETETTLEGTIAGASALSKRRDIRVIAALVVAQLGLWLAVMTPATLTLSLRVAEIDPARKSLNLSIVLGSGAFFLMFAAPLWGALSDATTHKWGRRRPYLVGGYIGGVFSTLAIALTSNIVLIAVAWSFAQVTFKAALISILACMGEFVPKKWQGRVSSVIGLTFAVAPFLGAFLVQFARQGPTLNPLLMFGLPIIISIIGVPWLAAVIPDHPTISPPRSKTGLLARIWINPLQRPDFGWKLLNRFLMYMAQASFMSYQAYFLIDHLQRPLSEIPHLVFLASAASAIGAIVGSPVAGYLSDRFSRKKIFVFISGVLVVSGLLLLSRSGDLAGFFVSATMIGTGMGVYYGTDLALAAAVLPDPNELGRGMGLLGLAGALPQSLAPAVAPLILATAGGNNYGLLFLIAATIALVGTISIAPIKCAR
jgi:MFS family permease